MVKKQFAIAVLLLFAFQAYAQLKVDADIRPRFEYRHGFGNLFPDNAEPAAFVQQRSRLNISYGIDKLQIMLSVQDVSVWGDTPQIAATDLNDSFSLFQAWISYELDENWSTKLGRQVLSYDDQRILGALDWALQGRFHDAALIKYKDDSFKADVGFAFSQQNVSNVGNDFFLQGAFTYKSMQFAHLHKDWEKLKASFLFLNTGFQNIIVVDEVQTTDGVFYRQTAGTYLQYPLNKVNLMGSAYYQFGKANANTDLSGYQFLIEATYKPQNTLYGAGIEILSGTDQDGDSKNRSFFPLYGTNHKFNGFMDYFFVGNHANNVGLNDFYAKVLFKTGEKSTLLLKGHYFTANADLTGNADAYLGSEVDLVFTQTLMKNVKLYLGYSHMFASDSMSLVKNGLPSDNTNNWAWAQLIVTPTLFVVENKQQD